MSTQDTLPPLPEPFYGAGTEVDEDPPHDAGYTADQMRSYATACCAAALRAAAVPAQQQWQPIETRPLDFHITYLVANKRGEVAPWIRGVIHNNPGTAWDWSYGEDAIAWQPLPAAPASPPIKD